MKTALITGSSKGIGEAIARVLFEAGYKVFLNGRDENALQKLSRELQDAPFLACDLTQEGSLQKLFQAVQAELGQIDVLVNNAGAYLWSPIDRTEGVVKDCESVFKLNSIVPLELCSLVVPGMKQNKWGRIINIGSISGVVGEPNASVYSASKASLIGLTKSLALELAEHGITVNLVNPGWVETALTQAAIKDGILDAENELQNIPQRRFIEPFEVAQLVKYLASEEAKGLTGQSINLCAGLSLG